MSDDDDDSISIGGYSDNSFGGWSYDGCEYDSPDFDENFEDLARMDDSSPLGWETRSFTSLGSFASSMFCHCDACLDLHGPEDEYHSAADDRAVRCDATRTSRSSAQWDKRGAHSGSPAVKKQQTQRERKARSRTRTLDRSRARDDKNALKFDATRLPSCCATGLREQNMCDDCSSRWEQHDEDEDRYQETRAMWDVWSDYDDCDGSYCSCGCCDDID